MICHHARELFTPLADDALDPRERAAVQAHLAGCAECRHDWARFELTVDALHHLPELRAPVGFVDRVLERARPEPWSRRLVRRLFVPLTVKLPLEVAAITLVSLGIVYLVQQSPELQQAAQSTAPRREAAPPSAAAPPQSERATSTERSDAPVTAERWKAAAPTVPAPQALSQPAPSEPARPEAKAQGALRKNATVESAPADAVPRTANASLTLAARSEEAASRVVSDALARAGGVEVGRRSEAGRLVVETELPRAGWAEFLEALRQAGGVTVDGEPTGTDERLRVIVRIGA